MAHVLSRSWLLHCRHVLHGVGVSLALPLLDCLQPLSAAVTKRRAKCGVFIYRPNGANSFDFQITKPEADYKFSRSLLRLEKQRTNFAPLSGFYRLHGWGASRLIDIVHPAETGWEVRNSATRRRTID